MLARYGSVVPAALAPILGLLLHAGTLRGEEVLDPLDGLDEAQLIDQGGHIIVLEGATQVVAGIEKLALAQILKRTDERIGATHVSLPHVPEPASDDASQGPYLYATSGGPGPRVLPLESTSAEVRIAGVIAHVEVTQVFENEGEVPIEAVYVFPASTRAAVHAMRMRIGDRTIEAQIEERRQAQEKYEQAKKQGKVASLLEEQRRNVFTMKVANIMPGAAIEVELEYSELLVPEGGTYEFVYPTVVGPRYPGSSDAAKDGWIESPYTGEGEKETYDFDLSIEVEAGMEIRDLDSPSHGIDIEHLSKTRARVGLSGSGGGNRDFVLRYSLADGAIESGVLVHENGSGDGGHFIVMMEPPAKPKPSQISARDTIFVLDVSGSMSGFPLETAKVLVKKLLSGIAPGDTFNIVLFAGGSARLSNGSIEASEANVQKAMDLVDDLQGGGATELMEALETAYSTPRPAAEGVSRTVVVVTDGFVNVEAQAFKFIRNNLGEANLFAFGIGSGVNRALIEGMSRAGMGEPFVVLDPASAPAQAARFRSYIESPVLTDVRVSFEGLSPVDVLPHQGRIPDLLAERPVVLVGRYEGEAKGTIRIEGRSGGKAFARTLDVGKSKSGDGSRPIGWLWARAWVALLEDQLWLLPGEKEIESAITLLGLDYSMLTSHTSFVAVDSKVSNECGKLVTVKQPLPLPAGVSNASLGGGGSGVGYGAGAGGLYGKGGIAPKIVAAAAMVKGSLAKDVIRDVVRQHKNEIRGCYEQALPGHPDLAGRVVVRFVIDTKTGLVLVAEIAESELEDEDLGECIASRVMGWTFPTVKGGGIVVVNYPFVLEIEKEGGGSTAP